MIEEPYRWVEAIANRREYIETQLATGSPIVAVGYRDGILFLTIGSGRQKIFEIYDRIAMGAIGHPGDIERLRMAAIELASTEGFTRSAADVSVRRLAHYSLSPVMKSAFEQVYGAPYLARLLFAEIGAKQEDDLYLRLEYDGAIAMNSSATTTRDAFAVVSGSRDTSEALESYLRTEHKLGATFQRALTVAIGALVVAQLRSSDPEGAKPPPRDRIDAARSEHLSGSAIEAAILERDSKRSIRYRTLSETEIRSTGGG
jgi:proteasome alpha subunit